MFGFPYGYKKCVVICAYIAKWQTLKVMWLIPLLAYAYFCYINTHFEL